MTRQMILDLPVRQARGRDDFFVAPPNALALATLDDCAGWPSGRMLLIGPEGAGKSHLAAIWAETQDAPVLSAAALTDAEAPPAAPHGAVVVEDAPPIPTRPAARVVGSTLKAGEIADYPLGRDPKAYLVPATGSVEIDGVRIDTRDGAAISDVETIRVTALTDSEIVLVVAA